MHCNKRQHTAPHTATYSMDYNMCITRKQAHTYEHKCVKRLLVGVQHLCRETGREEGRERRRVREIKIE